MHMCATDAGPVETRNAEYLGVFQTMVQMQLALILANYDPGG